MSNTKYLSILFTACVLLVVSQRPSDARADDKAFADSMKKYLATPEGQKVLGDTVETYFRKKQQDAMKAEETRSKADLEEQFKNPVKIDAGSSPSRGPAGAKVTIIEFSDFQCPFCKKGFDTMEEVMKAYPSDVKVVFKNLPLQMHPQAEPAAKAALAAGKQGKFWEMHDALFANQSKLNPDFYETQAKALGLNIDQFKKDMASPEIEAQIKADVEIANKQGIQGTPGFFVNGVAVRGAYPFDHFKMIIDRHLGKKS